MYDLPDDGVAPADDSVFDQNDDLIEAMIVIHEDRVSAGCMRLPKTFHGVDITIPGPCNCVVCIHCGAPR